MSPEHPTLPIPSGDLFGHLFARESPLALTVFDRTGQLRWFTDAARTLFGLGESAELDFLASFNILEDQALADVGFDIHVRTAMETGRPFRTPVQRWDVRAFGGERPDQGHQLYIRVTLYPIPGADGQSEHLVALLEDVTDQFQEEVQRAHDDARALEGRRLESLSVLAGGIAHQFNNLLTGIMGNANLARLELEGCPTAQENLVYIEEAAQRAATLCRQLSAYSGKGRFLVQTLLMADVVEGLRPDLEAMLPIGAQLDIEKAPDPPGVETDPAQIQQVVRSLVANAAEALAGEPGRVVVRTGAVTCTADALAATLLGDGLPTGRYVSLDVTDNGGGMTPETRSRIFDPFFTTKETGRGLGLAAVLGIVRGHGGTIDVRSEPGVGTTVRVLLPARDVPVPALSREEAEESANEMRGRTVLVVDDERMLQRLARRALERVGFEVVCGSNGAEALDLLQQRPQGFDIVLLDLQMPVMDGPRALRLLRELAPDIPIVISSGHTREEAFEMVPAMEGLGFVQKPFRAGELVAAIRSALGL